MGRFHLFASDLSLVALATFMALFLRDNFETTTEHVLALQPYLVVSLGAAAVIFPAFGAHRALWRFATLDDALAIVGAAVGTSIGAVAIGFSFNRLEGVPRSLPILQALLVVALLGGARLAVLSVGHARAKARLAAPSRAGDPPQKTTLVIGLGRLTDLYLRCVDELAASRVRVAGVLTENERQIGCFVRGVPVLGRPETIVETIRTLDIHGVSIGSVVVTTDFELLAPSVRDALTAIEREGRTRVERLPELLGLALYSELEDASALRPRTADADAEAALFTLNEQELAALSSRPIWRAKRAFDIGLASALLAVCAPVMALVGVAVAFDIGLPVTFWQRRPGLGGRAFELRKFRTMRPAFDSDGSRMTDDARLSGLGQLLRRTRLDELPQLLNILRGEMSFVGPRPLLPRDQPVECRGRLLVRPGLTGWAQVKGGREISIADKTALDLWYVRHASMTLDALILLQTARIVIFGERIDQRAVTGAWKELGERAARRAGAPEPALAGDAPHARRDDAA
ncbi:MULTISPECIES: sugar transferase [Methylosinus]|uniref:Sugar transferase n=1 Tax=Methylosinus trichosporium (strain ATCC 35070 / NCIMB 11131 / UNIQEM 75 / OB3b) TaxID=595536 RepID=A0A2D2CV25_METT3|nr:MULTISPECIES: sugar transferase [Methylosinus]ATQ66593.1 sugar transferase [Methylosinus trichosporium OB3b]OBS51675.1 hypothetical protein A8B73_14700 [Methylosinus sp. 3S-1]